MVQSHQRQSNPFAVLKYLHVDGEGRFHLGSPFEAAKAYEPDDQIKPRVEEIEELEELEEIEEGEQSGDGEESGDSEESEQSELSLRQTSQVLKQSWEHVRNTLKQPLKQLPPAMLCLVCESIFRRATPKDWFEKWHNHHQSLSALEDAATKGCVICKTVINNKRSHTPSTKFGNLERYPSKWEPDCMTGTQYRVDPFWPTIKIACCNRATGHLYTSPQFYITLFKAEKIESDMTRLFLPRATASEQVWNLCRYWLHQCRSKHQTCGYRRRNCSFRPTRLVRVERMDKNTIHARLECDPSAHPTAANYLTLSHWWGDIKFFTLRKENLRELQEEIVVDDLTKVFQHALLATLELGFSYIWIDSLCIVQDSEDDWQRESSQMGEIYKHSTCNLAATGFHDGSRGFLVERGSSQLPYHKVKANWSGNWGSADEPRSGCYYPLDKAVWRKQVTDAPLNRRGWVLQERLLSPCVIHFGKEQIFWECCELQTSDSFPKGFPDGVYLSPWFKKLPLYETQSIPDGEQEIQSPGRQPKRSA